MHSSPSSNSDSNKAIPDGKWKRPAISCITWILRVAVGCTFVFSGFVKAVDPWGTLYKFEEYIAALGIPVLHSLLLVGVFCLCAAEFMIGIFFLFGCYRKSNPIIALVFLGVMLPLTLWIAMADPVSDCGCFGDAVILSNWATFWKNVALTAAVLWLLRFNRRSSCIITPAFQWIASVVSAIFIVAIGLYGYMRQPLVDFRKYPVGNVLVDNSGAAAEAGEEQQFVFVYEKDGVRKEFHEDDELPDEEAGWKFVERRDIFPDKKTDASDNSESTFRVWSKDGEEDVTADAIVDEGDEIILMIPDVSKVSPATTWKINSLYDWSEAHDVEMIAVAAGSPGELSEWEDLSMPKYEVYTADDTAIKEVVRGNPAVIYLNNGVITWKSTLLALDADDFMDSGASSPSEFVESSPSTLRNCILLYIACIVCLIGISFTPKLASIINGEFLTRRRYRKNDENSDDGPDDNETPEDTENPSRQ